MKRHGLMGRKPFRHALPSAFDDDGPIPLVGSQPLFLPDLLEDAALRVLQYRGEECEAAHDVFKQWIVKLNSGVLDAMTETQLEQDFYKILLVRLGYATNADVSTGPWTLMPKRREAGRETPDATLGRFHWNEETKTIVETSIVVVELKGTLVDLDRKSSKSRSPVQQAWDYLNNSETAKWAIVSNFREFRLYSRNRSNRHVYRVALLDLADPKRFARFYAVFQAEALLGSESEPWSAANLLRETFDRREAVGEELYRTYSENRAALIREIQAKRSVDLDTAIQTAQRLLDRILFIAFAQARGLLSDPRLLKTTAEARLPGVSKWRAFQFLFQAIDTGDEPAGVPRYNGNLFKPDPILDDPQFRLDSDRWPQVFKGFGEYDYRNEVTVDVLGRIFERSITDIESIKSVGLGADEAEPAKRSKPSRRKTQGVYYTAAYVVEYLVASALDPLMDRRRSVLAEEFGIGEDDPPPAPFTRALLTWLDSLTLCDPACGSGAFLTEAYNWFETARCDLLRDLQLVDPAAPECFNERGMPGRLDDWQALSAPLILKNNIFGVDLSPESVEIAQLSLWIRTARRGRLLTDLSTNVVCGNSVVDSLDVDPTHAFDWSGRFPGVFERGGFDVVVGNPPYVRQERLTPCKSHWKERFPEIFDPIADLYVYFFGRGIEILKSGGRLAFICSNSFARSAFGEKLRTFLQTQATLEQFLDLGDTQVFKDAKDVYPALIVVEKRPPRTDDVVRSLRIRRAEDVTQIGKFAQERADLVPLARLSPAAWQFEDEAIFKLRAKLLADRTTLLDYVSKKIFMGIKTGLTEAFILNDDQKRAMEQIDPASASVLKPFKGGEHLRRWFQEESGKWLVFLPNGITTAQSGTTDEAEGFAWLSETYPALAEHLKSFEERARNRDDQGRFWWELRPCDYYGAFETAKIVYPDIAKSTRFSIDRAGAFLGNTTYFLPTDDEYLLGVLNSSATWFVLSGISIPFGERAGEFRYRLFTQYVGQIPIPDANEADRAAIAAIVRDAGEWARRRSEATEQVLRRFETAFSGLLPVNPSEKLKNWPRLSFSELGVELKKTYKPARNPWENPKSASEWDAFMSPRYEEHAALSRTILAAEREIDRRVFRLFGLTSDEIKRLEEASIKS